MNETGVAGGCHGCQRVRGYAGERMNEGMGGLHTAQSWGEDSSTLSSGLMGKKQNKVWICFETGYRAAIFWWHAVVLILSPHTGLRGLTEAVTKPWGAWAPLGAMTHGAMPQRKTEKGATLPEAGQFDHSFFAPCEGDETKSAWSGFGNFRSRRAAWAPIGRSNGVTECRETPPEGGASIGHLKSLYLSFLR